MQIEALEIEAICNEHIPIPNDQVLEMMTEMHLDARAVSAQRLGEMKTSIVIGADHYWSLVTGHVKSLTTTLKAVETLLGWTVQGPMPIGGNITHCASVVVHRATVKDNEELKVLNRDSIFKGIGIKYQDEQSSDTEPVLPRFGKALPKMDDRHEIAVPRKAVVYPANNLGVTKMWLHTLTNHRSKDAKPKKNGDDTILSCLDERTTEVQRAEHYLVGAEEDHFDVEAKCISKTHLCSHTPIEKLRLFVDGDDLLRVRGKASSYDTHGAQFPTLLPKYADPATIVTQHAHGQIGPEGVPEFLAQAHRKFRTTCNRQLVNKTRRGFASERFGSKPRVQKTPRLYK